MNPYILTFFSCFQGVHLQSCAFISHAHPKHSPRARNLPPLVGPCSAKSNRDTVVRATASSSSSSSSSPSSPSITTSSKKRKRAPTIPYIACTSTKELTRAVQNYLRPGDAVAELGSQLRDASAAICDAVGPGGRAVLVDVKRKSPSQERKKRGNENTRARRSTGAMRREGDEVGFYGDRATFVELDGSFERWRQELFFARADLVRDDDEVRIRMPSYTALVVDVQAIAGNDLDLTCLALVKDFLALNLNHNCADVDEDDSNINPCRVVIIKSGSLAKLARRIIPGPRLVKGQVTLPPDEEKSGSSKRTNAYIVGTVGVDEYRRTIPHVISKGDAVLEVGSHFGTSTALFHEAAQKINSDGAAIGGCIGVDIGPSIIERARKKFPGVPFVVEDAWHMAGLGALRSRYIDTQDNEGGDVSAAESNGRGYDVVYVDVGGLSGSEGLLEAVSLLSLITNSLEPRCIVIKSLCMRRLASSLTPFSAVWQEILERKE